MTTRSVKPSLQQVRLWGTCVASVLCVIRSLAHVCMERGVVPSFAVLQSTAILV